MQLSFCPQFPSFFFLAVGVCREGRGGTSKHTLIYRGIKRLLLCLIAERIYCNIDVCMEMGTEEH